MIVTEAGGETPGKAGFKMAITADGSSIGTIGGGAVEHKFFDMAVKMLEHGDANPFYQRQMHNGMEKEDSSGMICGGFQTILLYPIGKENFHSLKDIAPTIAKQENLLIRISPSGIFSCPSKDNCKMTFVANSDDIGEQWRYEEVTGFTDTVYIVGSGHVGLALSRIISTLGLRIVLLDDRREALEVNQYAHEKIFTSFKDIHKHILQGNQSYVVIMTPSHRADEIVLSQLISGNFAYLGMMGSKSKVKELFSNLRNSGFSEKDIKKVKAPIGLPINSSTPAEIAISVAAEIIQVRNIV